MINSAVLMTMRLKRANALGLLKAIVEHSNGWRICVCFFYLLIMKGSYRLNVALLFLDECGRGTLFKVHENASIKADKIQRCQNRKELRQYLEYPLNGRASMITHKTEIADFLQK